MTGYGSSLYGTDWYTASPYVTKTERSFGLCARIVKPVASVPPVMDSIAYGLAQRFDWLQQALQSFSLFGKIEYATGKSNGFVASLDDVWGKLYDLPRITGESDGDYRSRLQSYVQVLTGSGTIPNCEAVLDFVVGLPRTTQITSMWPAKAQIRWTTVEAMRAARLRLGLINTILPGMFAAGVDYELVIPLQDIYIAATIRGDATLQTAIRATIASEQSLTFAIDALISYTRTIATNLVASIATERDLSSRLKAAMRAERGLDIDVAATVQGNPELPVGVRAAVQAWRVLYCDYNAAIQAQPVLYCGYNAAIARTFDVQFALLAMIVHMYESLTTITAAVQVQRELSVGIRVRIAKTVSGIPDEEIVRGGFDFTHAEGLIYLGAM